MVEQKHTPPGKGNEHLRFPFEVAPTPGTLIDVAPGVKWVRMPLPFRLNHINLWILDDGDGWTLVDAGINTNETQALWTDLFAGPLSAKPLKRVICTHYHPDHMGLAGWLSETYGVKVWATPKEIETARFSYGLSDAEVSAMTRDFFKRGGVPRASSEMPAGEDRNFAQFIWPLPAEFSVVDPAQPVNAAKTTWQIVVGEGHSPQLAGLHAAGLGVLIAGDQVLPGITPNVSVFNAEDDSNPLQLFLDSLQRYRALPPDALVLPSHKLPFYGLQERVDQITAHHEERLVRVRIVCAKSVTAAEVLPAIFDRTFEGIQLRFALGETMAHLNYLIGTGEIVRETTPEGVYLYRAV